MRAEERVNIAQDLAIFAEYAKKSDTLFVNMSYNENKLEIPNFVNVV
jgi:hypothetical protein